jgi:hypothetical protein
VGGLTQEEAGLLHRALVVLRHRADLEGHRWTPGAVGSRDPPLSGLRQGEEAFIPRREHVVDQLTTSTELTREDATALVERVELFAWRDEDRIDVIIVFDEQLPVWAEMLYYARTYQFGTNDLVHFDSDDHRARFEVQHAQWILDRMDGRSAEAEGVARKAWAVVLGVGVAAWFGLALLANGLEPVCRCGCGFHRRVRSRGRGAVAVVTLRFSRQLRGVARWTGLGLAAVVPAGLLLGGLALANAAGSAYAVTAVDTATGVMTVVLVGGVAASGPLLVRPVGETEIRSRYCIPLRNQGSFQWFADYYGYVIDVSPIVGHRSIFDVRHRNGRRLASHELLEVLDEMIRHKVIEENVTIFDWRPSGSIGDAIRRLVVAAHQPGREPLVRFSPKNTPSLASAPTRPLVQRSALLRVRNYRLFIVGQTPSMIATWMHLVAQDMLVLRLSGGSLSEVGVVSALQFGPMLFAWMFGLVAEPSQQTADVDLPEHRAGDPRRSTRVAGGDRRHHADAA